MKDIAISSNNPIFDKYDVPRLEHCNEYTAQNWKIEKGDWLDCFYPTNEPVCYLFGDVFYSDEAIKKIVQTETDDIEFFGSKEPFAKNYIKTHIEPFAFKVVDIPHLNKAIKETRKRYKDGKLFRMPIAWDLWLTIKGIAPQKKDEPYPAEYTVINDYTCDVDWNGDVIKLNNM